MMIPLKDILLKYDIQPKGVIVVGAHWAEEHDEFLKCGIERFVYIEPCNPAFMKINKKFYDYGRRDYYWDSINQEIKYGEDVRIYNVACGAEEKEMPMYVSHNNQGQSNSLLKPNLHLHQHPEIVFDDAEIVKVITLDNLPINKKDYDFLYMDVQGAEGLVLKGSEETLKNISIIYTECNRDETYDGNMKIEEMDEYLGERGFKRVETYWPSPNWSWGDSIYTRI